LDRLFSGTAPAKSNSGSQAGGCAALIGIILLIAMCSGGGGTGNETAPDPKVAAANEAEKKRKGFHCLSAWDGSHRDVVRSLKRSLRDPDSFEHEETRITPVDDKGNHTLLMTYRARNGFGGMNIGKLAATVRNSDCSFTIVANADD
jgi:hypothetical protein